MDEEAAPDDLEEGGKFEGGGMAQSPGKPHEVYAIMPLSANLAMLWRSTQP
jgi:hypothetical protein